MSGRRITLDDTELAGRLRLRRTNRPTSYSRRPVIASRRMVITEFVTGTQSPSFVGQTTAKQIQPKQNQNIAITPHKTLTENHKFYPQETVRPRPKRAQHNDERLFVKSKIEKAHKKKSINSKNNRILMSMAVFLFFVGIGVTIWQIKTNRHVAAQVQGVVNAQSKTDASGLEGLDETESTDHSNYWVPPDNPRLLNIPKISVNARVRKMGVMANGQLKSPANIFDTGWYEKSAKPTDPGGALLIDGHVHGPTKPGVFKNLSKLARGDKVQIETGAGNVVNFSVVKAQSFDANNVDMNSAMVSVDSSKLGLNIITCSGNIDDSGNHYQQRLIVYTVKE